MPNKVEYHRHKDRIQAAKREAYRKDPLRSRYGRRDPVVVEGYKRDWYVRNKEKILMLKKVRYTADPDRFRKATKSWTEKHPLRHVQQRYKISPNEYEAMLKAQNGRCAICGVARPPQARRLAVDHCHATGRRRGLLCGACNIGIGLFRDDIHRLLKAVSYLLNYQEKIA